MSGSDLDVLRRWEEGGARWKLRWRGRDEALVDLLSCDGELMDELRSRDPRLLAYLELRADSED